MILKTLYQNLSKC